MERDIAKEKQEIWIEGREELSDDRRVTKNNSSAFREVWTRWKDDDWRCDGQLSDAPLLFSTKETLLSLNTVQVKQQERGLIDRCQWRPLNSDLICGFSDGVTDDGQVSKLFFCSWWSLEKKCWLCYDSFWIFEFKIKEWSPLQLDNVKKDLWRVRWINRWMIDGWRKDGLQRWTGWLLLLIKVQSTFPAFSDLWTSSRGDGRLRAERGVDVRRGGLITEHVWTLSPLV